MPDEVQVVDRTSISIRGDVMDKITKQPIGPLVVSVSILTNPCINDIGPFGIAPKRLEVLPLGPGYKISKDGVDLFEATEEFAAELIRVHLAYNNGDPKVLIDLDHNLMERNDSRAYGWALDGMSIAPAQPETIANVKAKYGIDIINSLWLENVKWTKLGAPLVGLSASSPLTIKLCAGEVCSNCNACKLDNSPESIGGNILDPILQKIIEAFAPLVPDMDVTTTPPEEVAQKILDYFAAELAEKAALEPAAAAAATPTVEACNPAAAALPPATEPAPATAAMSAALNATQKKYEKTMNVLLSQGRLTMQQAADVKLGIANELYPAVQSIFNAVLSAQSGTAAGLQSQRATLSASGAGYATEFERATAEAFAKVYDGAVADGNVGLPPKHQYIADNVAACVRARRNPWGGRL